MGLRYWLSQGSALPWSAFDMAWFLAGARERGFDGVTLLPTKSLVVPATLTSFVKGWEGAWNPGGWLDVLAGYLNRNPRSPKPQDAIFFPSGDALAKAERFLQGQGYPEIVHQLPAKSQSGGSGGTVRMWVEISPRLRKSGDELANLDLQYVFDTHHATRNLRLDELRVGEKPTSALGNWRLWLPSLVKLGKLACFDFKLLPGQAMGSPAWGVGVSMLAAAWDAGYRGPVRLEVVDTLGKQLFDPFKKARAVRDQLNPLFT